jgi:transcriptional regulator NrdR family protein
MVTWWGGRGNPRNQEVMTGIYCKSCGCRLSEVIETRKVGDRIRRRRRCLHEDCGRIFFTWEMAE